MATATATEIATATTMERITDIMFAFGGHRGSEGRDTPPAPPATPQRVKPTQDTDLNDDEYSFVSRDTAQQEDGRVPTAKVNHYGDRFMGFGFCL